MATFSVARLQNQSTTEPTPLENLHLKWRRAVKDAFGKKRIEVKSPPPKMYPTRGCIISMTNLPEGKGCARENLETKEPEITIERKNLEDAFSHHNSSAKSVMKAQFLVVI